MDEKTKVLRKKGFVSVWEINGFCVDEGLRGICKMLKTNEGRIASAGAKARRSERSERQKAAERYPPPGCFLKRGCKLLKTKGRGAKLLQKSEARGGKLFAGKDLAGGQVWRLRG